MKRNSNGGMSSLARKSPSYGVNPLHPIVIAPDSGISIINFEDNISPIINEITNYLQIKSNTLRKAVKSSFKVV
jgi:hypothetical protein